MAIRMRTGTEDKFDANKMVPGEWAVSTDKKYVRMCFAPGVCVRMALYDAFEGDVVEIQKILAECRTIEETVDRIQEEIGQKAEVITSNAEIAQNASNTASQKATEALESANSANASANTAMQEAENAQESANSAETSKTQAENYAQNASKAANDADEKAQEANASAVSASGYAARAEESADNASNNALEAESYAHGDTGIRESENTDNALYYKEQARNEADRAKAEADRASNIAGIGIATTEKAGIVKPDGTTVTIDEDGTLHSAGGGGTSGTINYDELENQPAINGVTLQGDKTLSELGIQPKGDYALVSGTGHSLSLSIDSTTYIMTLSLLNESGEILSTKSIDFPLESMVVNAEYYLGTLTLILQNGQSIDVDVSAIVSGLVKDTFTIAGINMKDNITAEELRTALGVQNIPNVATNDQTPIFTQSTTRENISSGEKLHVIFGKIMKWFADLKAVAFSGSWNDLSDRPTIPTVGNGKITINQAGVKKGEFTTNQSGDISVNLDGGSDISLTNNLLATVAGTALDAMQGKILDDKVAELNDNIAFPDGVGFYLDMQNGVRGYNTDAARGADTFHPFSNGG
ncbi:MAG: hypothetical protein K2N15_10845, partial [Lachnospiraceae bacterium]|nr:hypothetical protein [Lachnospiraceae bacterium]